MVQEKTSLEVGFLEREISLALQIDQECEKVLEEAIVSASNNEYDLDFLTQQFSDYWRLEKYSHCHFIAILVGKTAPEQGMILMEKNSGKYMVSKFHHAWNEIRYGDKEVGVGLLRENAKEGHLFSKRALLKFNSKGAMKFFFYPIIVFLMIKGIFIALFDVESVKIKNVY